MKVASPGRAADHQNNAVIAGLDLAIHQAKKNFWREIDARVKPAQEAQADGHITIALALGG